MPDFVRFQTRVILDLYGVPFHAMVVVGSEHDFSIKSASAYCEGSTGIYSPTAAAVHNARVNGDIQTYCVVQ